MTNEYAYPSWISDPVSIPGQLSLLDEPSGYRVTETREVVDHFLRPIAGEPEPIPVVPAPDPDPTPPHGLARLDWTREVQLHTTDELVAWGQTQLVECDEESDLVDAIRLELERRGVRLFGRWTR